ncbi:hypothetical protein HNQ50_002589 [Silvimonas terrae]|uniref:DUF484 family protein n=1 Tax=Silvimonas terrae TaxID=300266 RepID=A0A840REB8_9NEIS|nr:DUF484 family protein [Silvimonas terrae]MBB5191859.1 hypothetical protein [Silvimonas terrae]
MQAQEVMQWLQENPGFFEDYADEIADIFVPHSHNGQAVSLAERQLLTLREKNRAMEMRMAELLQFGEENDVISDLLQKLAVGLMQANDLPGIVGTLEYHLKERFLVPHVALRLWLPADAQLREFTPVGEAVYKLANNLVSPYCGPYVTDEVVEWFEGVGAELKSFALFALRTSDQPFGIMVLASNDPDRFFPDMGTLYLQRLSELLAAAIRRVVPSGPPVLSAEVTDAGLPVIDDLP